MSPILYVVGALIAAFFVAGTTYAATTGSGASDPSNDPNYTGDSSIDPGAGAFDDYENLAPSSTVNSIISAISQGVTAIVNQGFSQKIVTFANAIAFAEGYGGAGAIPTVANDPGDLSKGDFGDTGFYLKAGDGEQVIKYPTAQDGFNALYQKLQNIVNGGSSVYSLNMSILQMGNKYSGNGSVWSRNVVSYLNQQGVNATQQTLLAEVLI